MTTKFDIIIIGAGIAGTSAAAELSASANVALLDMEAQPGFHATGRSAAFFAASYGSTVVRGITASSEHFYRAPPSGFTEVPLLKPRDALYIARADQRPKMDKMEKDNPFLIPIRAEMACTQIPILDSSYVSAALRDDLGGDLDVDAILQAYLRLFRKRGGHLGCEKQVNNMNFQNGHWTVQFKNQSISAPIVVNAAGAWAGRVAELAGLTNLGLQPKKRTALLLDPTKLSSPSKVKDIANWPLVIDVDEEFYFKPDAGQLLISPADESPCDPCDAQPDELDIAIAMDRFETACALNVKRINHSWAGLRTFAPDNNFIVGFDPRTAGFFWLAGQGGYGVQSAPGLAQLVNILITGASLTGEFLQLLNYRDDVAPERLIE